MSLARIASYRLQTARQVVHLRFLCRKRMESGIIIPLLRSDQAISLALPPHTHCTSAIFCRFARLQALGQVVRIGYCLCHLSGLDAVSDNVLLIHHVPQLFHYTGTRSHSHGAQHRVSGQQVLLPLPVSVNQSPIRPSAMPWNIFTSAASVSRISTMVTCFPFMPR